MQKAFRYIGIIISIILFLALSINLFLIYSGKKDSSFFGITTAIVLSGSMENEISIGDMVVIKKEKQVNKGDIIAFNEGSMLVTHRIIEVTQKGFITKGDANNTPDEEITKEQVEGKIVLIIPKAGFLIEKLRTPIGMLVLSMIILCIYFLPNGRKNNK